MHGQRCGHEVALVLRLSLRGRHRRQDLADLRAEFGRAKIRPEHVRVLGWKAARIMLRIRRHPDHRHALRSLPVEHRKAPAFDHRCADHRHGGLQPRLGRLEIDPARADHLRPKRCHEPRHTISNVVTAFPDKNLKRFVRPAIGFHVVASMSVNQLDGVAVEREEFDVGVAELDAEDFE